MSGDYISRDAAIERATRDLFDGQTADYVAADIKEKLNAVPAADVAPVRHGKWERTDGNSYPSCSECGCESLSRANRPYCQFCGAKMDGKSADYAPAKPYDLLYEEGGPDA